MPVLAPRQSSPALRPLVGPCGRLDLGVVLVQGGLERLLNPVDLRRPPPERFHLRRGAGQIVRPRRRVGNVLVARRLRLELLPQGPDGLNALLRRSAPGPPGLPLPWRGRASAPGPPHAPAPGTRPGHAGRCEPPSTDRRRIGPSTRAAPTPRHGPDGRPPRQRGARPCRPPFRPCPWLRPRR